MDFTGFVLMIIAVGAAAGALFLAMAVRAALPNVRGHTMTSRSECRALADEAERRLRGAQHSFPRPAPQRQRQPVP